MNFIQVQLYATSKKKVKLLYIENCYIGVSHPVDDEVVTHPSMSAVYVYRYKLNIWI